LKLIYFSEESEQESKKYSDNVDMIDSKRKNSKTTISFQPSQQQQKDYKEMKKIHNSEDPTIPIMKIQAYKSIQASESIQVSESIKNNDKAVRSTSSGNMILRSSPKKPGLSKYILFIHIVNHIVNS
jgi:hypothetical protein